MQQMSVQNIENKIKRMIFLGGNDMFKQMKKRVKNQKGLTLIELLAVVVILGIIAAIAVPAIGNIMDKSRGKALVADAVNVMNAANLYFVENPKAKDVTAEDLKKAGFLESAGKLNQKETKVTNASPDTITVDGINGNITFKKSDLTLEQLNVDNMKISEDNEVEFDTSTGDSGAEE